jgi:hypothetical protein
MIVVAGAVGMSKSPRGFPRIRGTKQEDKVAISLKLIRRMVDIVEGWSLDGAPRRRLDPDRVRGRPAAV